MIIGTCLAFGAGLGGLAWLGAVDIRMVFEFLPAMAERARSAIWTSNFVISDEGIRVP